MDKICARCHQRKAITKVWDKRRNKKWRFVVLCDHDLCRECFEKEIDSLMAVQG